MKNPVVHFEILGPDGAKLIDFYRVLFGWPIVDNQLPGWPHYGFMKAERGMSGAVGL
jgi:predicted enzyme related to lactoylglutathione lyase